MKLERPEADTSRSVEQYEVIRAGPHLQRYESDAIAVEEPLEIRVVYHQGGKMVRQSVSVTMRTPGHDEELALGFLWTEGIVTAPAQVQHVGPPALGLAGQAQNVVEVVFSSGAEVQIDRLQRHFYTSSSCGVCGRSSIAAISAVRHTSFDNFLPIVSMRQIFRLPEMLRQEQTVFDRTGGLHASALFHTSGELMLLREDVGRHNALDKVIGASLLARRLPLSETILVVSGRASFELVQKAMMGGIRVMAAVGAPSSLAIDAARSCGMTLIGFLRDQRANIYTGQERVCA